MRVIFCDSPNFLKEDSNFWNIPIIERLSWAASYGSVCQVGIVLGQDLLDTLKLFFFSKSSYMFGAGQIDCGRSEVLVVSEAYALDVFHLLKNRFGASHISNDFIVVTQELRIHFVYYLE